jgi:uncharacterized protein (DUF697 family)
MKIIQSIWQFLLEKAIKPHTDEAELQAILAKAKSALPTPIFWLLGKVQQGKTSIIRALTERSDAEIGKGFSACTRTSSVYSFPSDDDCLLRFLDTRGLGEINYEPAEDLALFAGQAHCLMVVVKAMDHAQCEVLAALKKIVKTHPGWPVIVCQTTLHEGYPSGVGHVEPYPYRPVEKEDWLGADGGESRRKRLAATCLSPFSSDAVPHDLARSLVTQREWFAGMPVQFVPLDFTYADHGQWVYPPSDYGLDALWDAIEAAVPLGLRDMVRSNNAIRKQLHDAYFDTAHKHILAYATAAGGAGLIPLPYVDVPLVLSIQAKLFHTVGAIYDQPMNVQQMATIASGLGAGYLARFGVRELTKLIPIPGVGSAISGAFAAASTYALGIALCEYFGHLRDGNVPDAKRFHQWYQEAFTTAKKRFDSSPIHSSDATDANSPLSLAGTTERSEQGVRAESMTSTDSKNSPHNEPPER